MVARQFIMIAGPPGAGKSTFANILLQTGNLLVQQPYYQELDYLRHLMQGVESEADLSFTDQQRITQEALQLYDELLAQTLREGRDCVIVEHPFHKFEHIERRINQAREAGYTPDVILLFAGSPEEVVNRDIARRFPAVQDAQKAIDRGLATHVVRQSLAIQAKLPGVFDELVRRGITTSLWDTSSLVPGRMIAQSEKAWSLQIIQRDRYEAFRKTADINPDASFRGQTSELYAQGDKQSIKVEPFSDFFGQSDTGSSSGR
jgi:adenylate kinase family enzyme